MEISWNWYAQNTKINSDGSYAPIVDLCVITTELTGEVLYSVINMWADTAVNGIMTTRSEDGIEIMLHLHSTWEMN